MALHIVIPARYASARLPAKPLLAMAGKPLVQHVWDNAVCCGADSVTVATDDARIARAVQAFGGRALMTRADHETGTDRLAEVCERSGWADDDLVVNLQGDEPLVAEPEISRVAGGLRAQPHAGIGTLATPIRSAAELFDPNAVKVVLGARGMAHYFSRAPVPWVRGVFETGAVAGRLPDGVTFLRHIGLYAYRAGTLGRIAGAPASALERAEGLEQLRALGMGIGIHVSVVEEAPGHGVDTEADVERVRQLLGTRGAAQ